MPAALAGLFILCGIWFSVFVLKIATQKRTIFELKRKNLDLQIENSQLNQLLLRYGKGKEEDETGEKAG